MDRNCLDAKADSVSKVALRKESVDRNRYSASRRRVSGRVALRKESVDRNCYFSFGLSRADTVALRKESVDRNTSIDNLTQGIFSRSPQGERG